MRIGSKDAYAFEKMLSPIKISGHEIYILENDAFVDTEDRLKIHITLHCPKCDRDRTVRGHLPREYTDYSYRAALAKFIALGYFTSTCPNQ